MEMKFVVSGTSPPPHILLLKIDASIVRGMRKRQRQEMLQAVKHVS